MFSSMDDGTASEIEAARSLGRIEAQLTMLAKSIESVHHDLAGHRQDNSRRLDELEKRVREMETRVSRFAGVAGVLAVIGAAFFSAIEWVLPGRK